MAHAISSQTFHVPLLILVSFYSHLHAYEDGQTQCFETSAYKIQTPGNYPKESIQIYFYLKYSFCKFLDRTAPGRRTARPNFSTPLQNTKTNYICSTRTALFWVVTQRIVANLYLTFRDDSKGAWNHATLIHISRSLAPKKSKPVESSLFWHFQIYLLKKAFT